MKNTFILIAVVALFSSCQKEAHVSAREESYLENVIASLRDSFTTVDFEKIDLSKTFESKVKDNYLVRLGLKGKSITSDFVVLNTTKEGDIKRGLIVHLEKDTVHNRDKSKFEGFITLSSLNKKPVLHSKVVNGFIVGLHNPAYNQRSLVEPRPNNVLPDVVVTWHISSGGISFSDWMNLLSLFGVSGGGSGMYNSLDGDGGAGYGGGGSYGGGSGGSTDATILIDYEPDDISAIDIDKFIKCFSNIPDNGSQCSVEILTDIPVDTDPNRFFNISNGSPGHTFLQIKKSNGAQSVSQNIGFYPNQGWKTMLNPSPLGSKVVDNGGHEFNASLKRGLTPEQLKNMLNVLQYLAKNSKYDIDEYNCTDFALDVFNSASTLQKLEIPKFNIPIGITPANTPQGLFQKLKSMKNAGVESNNINIPGVKGWVANSSGPCN